MVVKQLSFPYLTDMIGFESFNLTKKSLEQLISDGHFIANYNDKDLACLIFENSISNDFFYSKKRLHEFVNALPEITVSTILDELNIETVKELEWDENVSEYFISKLGLDRKFKFRQEQETSKTRGIAYFEAPDIIFKNLKSYQAQVYFKTFEYLEKTPYARCIIQMPTGSGKTRTAMEIVCETINSTGKDVLWLANTEELCDQAYESFQEIWHFLKKRKAKVINHIRFNEPVLNDENPCFHISSLQSLNSKKLERKLEDYGIFRDKLEIVIIDEAHIAIAPTYKETISSLISEGTKLVGLTATPGRSLNCSTSELDNENRALSDFFYNKKFELETGDDLPIEFLREQGILSNAKFKSIEGTRIEQCLSKLQIGNAIKARKIPRKIVDILVNDEIRNSIIFDQLIEVLTLGKKVIFFGTSLEHSKLISTLINAKGFKSAHIDGNSGTHRKSIITAFKNRELDLLCNYGVLSTGFDDPKIDVVFMARPTNSIVLYSQIIGRGLRGPLIGGTDTCEIITVLDNIVDLPDNNKIYTYFDEYFIN